MIWPLSDLWLSVIGAGAVGLLLGYLLGRLRGQRDIQDLSIEVARLETELDADEAHYEAQLALLQDARDRLSRQFAVLSQRALKNNNALFLKLAEQNLRLQQQRASAELDKRQQQVDHLLEPIREALKATHQQIQQVELERRASFASLEQQVRALHEAESELRGATHDLAHALKRNDVRGRWGELSLRRLVELAGMVAYADFQEQPTSAMPEQRLRPDLIVRLPEQRELIIDAKTSLSAYLDAIDATSEEQRVTLLKRHARNFRNRMRELASKQYWAQFKRSPDYVVMFVPGDQFLAAALQYDDALLDDSLKQKVVPATPATLLALLRSVAFGWRQNQFSANAEKLREAGETLYARFAGLTEQLDKLGQHLDAGVRHYNKTVDVLETQLSPLARQMQELGIESSRTPATLNGASAATRRPSTQQEGHSPSLDN